MPEPLHPALVHFPIALAVVAAALAPLAAWWLHRHARSSPHLWTAVVLLQAAVLGSGTLALWTGERDEERIEQRMPAGALESHEEAAQGFLALSGVVLLAACGGLMRGTPGASARAISAALALGLAASVLWVGHSGGALVYRHGAAAAFAASIRPPEPWHRGRTE